MASCLAFEAGSGFDLEGVEKGQICLRAERDFVGVQCGIMDQFISALGQKDHALFIDTRSLEFESVPLPASGISMVICNSNKPRGLVESEYNKRRAECEEADSLLNQYIPNLSSLRDVAITGLERYQSRLPETIFRRARHVVTENMRVVASVSALKAGNVAEFGRLMNESHDSLRYDYEVSCKELDILVEAARSVIGVYGSRMTGAGFGGCTISLVADEAVQEFKKVVGSEYSAATGLRADIYICRAADGARRLQ